MRTHLDLAPTIARVGLLVLCLIPGAAFAHTLEYLGTTQAPGGVAEIIAYDARVNRLYTTSNTGIDCYAFGDAGDLKPIRTIDLGGVFGVDAAGQSRLGSVSSVAIDPSSRGFGAATAIPKDNTLNVGVLVLFDLVTSKTLCRLPVGYHPDMVGFSPNGDYLLIANEGEAKTDQGYRRDPEGSVSVIDLRRKMVNDLQHLTTADVRTVNFAGGNLDRPDDLLRLRIDPSNQRNLTADLEPEYIAVAGGHAYVALQENNGVGVLDLETLRWKRLHDLGGAQQVIDASDKDGVGIFDRVFGLHMPDTIAAFEHKGKPYFVTANEGDPRPDVPGEGVRVADIDPERFSPELARSLNARYRGNFQDEQALGRLEVTTLPNDCDTDGDGKIDRLTMYGTRSFSVFEGDTGKRIYDSGSSFARLTADLFPDQFNGQDNAPENKDSRSDNRGCEPEGLAITEINGSRLCAIGLERVGGVMLYDLTDPTNPVFLQYIHSALGHGSNSSRPEGLVWIKPNEATQGKAFLAVAYEESGTIDVFELKLD